jgi:hypothetical protein
LSSHVAIAIAGTTVVVSVPIAAVVLRDSVLDMVTVVMASPVGDGARRRHRGDAGREQDKSCDQQAANPVNEHCEFLCRGETSAAEPFSTAMDRFG